MCTQTAEYKIMATSVKLVKIELNSEGDFVLVPTDDCMLISNLADSYKRILVDREQCEERMSAIRKQYETGKDTASLIAETCEIANVKNEFSENAVKEIDSIFGAGTVKKYFCDLYREIPEFEPDADCIEDFFEQLMTAIEQLYVKN